MSAKPAMSGKVQQHETPESANGHCHSIKRMIFVASMYFWMNGINHPTKDQLAEVNRRFDLVNRASCLLFPAAISSIVWSKIDLESLVARYKADPSALAIVTMELLSKTPDWVKYHDPEGIIRDIKAVFDSWRAA